MGMYEEINAFVDAMIGSEAEFINMKTQFDKKNEDVESCIQEFRGKVSNVLSRKIETEDKEIQAMYDGFSERLQKLLDEVASCMENTKKGMKFITDYEQSFNIAVFGKVKAGKSYLGNFIMGNIIRDMHKGTSYDKLARPKVEVYDRGKKYTRGGLAEILEEGKENFRVDPNEATSAIQLFRLGGMTWFDTPGIGSVTWENEMLAKEYVDNADLIVYTSNSDAAGTRQDFDELGALHQKGKKFLLLLTQSDTVEEDEGEDGELIAILIPKSDKDRKGTEAYICDALRDNNIAGLDRDREILTVSAKLAFTALENGDEKMFEASNIGKFLAILTDITRNEGAKLKMKTPGDRMNATILAILDHLKRTQCGLKEYRDSLVEKQKQMGEKGKLLTEDIQSRCINGVNRVIREKSSEVEAQGSAISASELEELLNREVYQVLSHACMGEFEKSGEILSDCMKDLKVGSVGELKEKTDTIEYTVKKVVSVPREPHGLFEHIGSFFLDKTYYKTEVGTEKETSVIKLGVNEQQIMSIARQRVSVLFEETVPDMMERISRHFMEPMIRLLDSAEKGMEEAVKELEQLKC